MAEETKLEKLAKPFTPFEIDQMYFNPVLARLNLAELYQAFNSAPKDTDSKTLGEIKGKIGTVERIIKDLMQAQSTPEKGEPPMEAMLQSPMFHGGDKATLKEKQIKNILSAQEKFKEIFYKFDFKSGKIIAVDIHGNQIDEPKLIPGQPSKIAGFAGSDKEALKEISDATNDIYTAFARAGFDVKKVEKDGRSFFAVLLPEGLENNDPLTMTKSQIEDALQKKEKESPPKIIDSATDENNKEAFEAFEKRVSAVAVVEGSAKDMMAFRAAEIASWWKEMVREKKGKTKASAEQLTAETKDLSAGR